VFDIREFLLPRPTQIAAAFVDTFTVIVPAGWLTMRKAMLGFAVGATAGICVALATSRWRPVSDAMMPFAIAVNSTPIIALAPIMNNWFPITSIWPGATVVALVVIPVIIKMCGACASAPGSSSWVYGAARDLGRCASPAPFLVFGVQVRTTLSVIAAIVSVLGGTATWASTSASKQLFISPRQAAILVASSGIVLYQ
jgi:hypothetical protein